MCVCVCARVCVCMCVCVCVCVYIYIYIYCAFAGQDNKPVQDARYIHQNNLRIVLSRSMRQTRRVARVGETVSA